VRSVGGSLLRAVHVTVAATEIRCCSIISWFQGVTEGRGLASVTL
jgi:hypothetical protein